MKVRTQKLGQPAREMELERFLKPCNTGSAQGSIEQLQTQVEILETTVGRLLAHLVEHNFVHINSALSIAGVHESYIEYRYGTIELLP